MNSRALTLFLLAALALCANACSSTLAQQKLSAGDVSSLEAFPHDRFDAIAKAHVDTKGRTDYTALKANSDELVYFSAAVASAGPDGAPALHPDGNHALAFYINGYNALAMLNVLSRYPDIKDLDSLSKQADFFVFTELTVDGKVINLKDLENEVVRPYARKYYKGLGKVSKLGRVHFALNCASAGCPRLPNEGFDPARLDEQLDRETNRFVREERNVSVNHKRRVVTLSKIFEWYAEDFTDDSGKAINQLAWINQYLPENEKVPEEYELEFRDYDWTLNDQKLYE
jgi:hypothetical protein